MVEREGEIDVTIFNFKEKSNRLLRYKKLIGIVFPLSTF